MLIGSIYALLSFGLSIHFGVMNLINFAHGDFVMLAMYGTFFSYTYLGLEPFLSSIITVPLFFIIGVMVYKTLIKKIIDSSQLVQIAVTVGLFMIMRGVAYLVFSPTPKSLKTELIRGSINLFNIPISYSRIIFAAISIGILIILHIFLTRTYTGLAFRAVSDDRIIPSTLGVNTDQIYALAFGLGTGLAAVAGSFLMSFSYVDPLQGVRFIIIAWVIVIMAGLGTIRGIIFSGWIVGVIESIFTFYWQSQGSWLFVFVIFLLILWIKPRGLWGVK